MKYYIEYLVNACFLSTVFSRKYLLKLNQNYVIHVDRAYSTKMDGFKMLCFIFIISTIGEYINDGMFVYICLYFTQLVCNPTRL